MPKLPRTLLITVFLTMQVMGVHAQTPPQVLDIPTRPGVTQRLLVLSPPHPKAAVVLFAGGHGGLQMQSDGSVRWGGGNFLVRTRQMFADQGLVVAVIDAPSDRQGEPFLEGFRLTDEHMADIKAVIQWLRESAKVPVWLVGTSRGTQSVAYAGTQLTGAQGPDGIVLTSSILSGRHAQPVLNQPLGRVAVPTLVVHHEQDGCKNCPFSDVPTLMARLDHAPAKKMFSFTGGADRGDACGAFAHHGYNGIERDVVQAIAAWILENPRSH